MADYVPIESQDDPRLVTDFDPVTYSSDVASPEEPVTQPAWNPDAYASGEGKPKRAEPKALPTRTPDLSTFYYPSTAEDQLAHGLSPKMEGGPYGAGNFSKLQLQNHTLEQFLDGKSDFVAVAMKGAPTGELFQTTIKGNPVTAKWVDTGGGLRDGQIDFATSNPELARTGIDRPWNPDHYAEGKPQPSVPGIHAFMEPASDDTPEAESKDEPSTAEVIGGAVGKGISKFGKALSDRPIPEFKTPQFQPTPIPQATSPGQYVGTPSGPMIPTSPAPQAQPLPTPGAVAPVAPITGGLMDTVRGALLPFGTTEDPKAQYPEPGMEQALARMFPDQIQAIQQNVAEIKADPTSRRAYNAYGQLAMTVGPFAARGITEVAGVKVPGITGGSREVPYTDPFQPKGATQAQAPLVQPQQPQGLPFKAASVQGLKNPPRTIQPKSTTGDYISSLNQDINSNYGWSLNRDSGAPGRYKISDRSGNDIANFAGSVRNGKLMLSNIEALADSTGQRLKGLGLVDKIFSHAAKFSQANGLTVETSARTSPVTRAKFDKHFGQPPTPPQGPPPPAGVPPVPPAGGVPPQPPKTLVQGLTLRKIVKGITQKVDSVFTRSDYDARQAVNPLRQEFGQDVMGSPKSVKNIQAAKDLEAATFIAEAGGNKLALQHDLELVRNSKNKKLAEKYAPKLQYALDNFDRISQIKNRYGKLMQDQIAEDAAAGITYGEREGYVTHVFKNEPENTLLSFMTGGGTGAGGFSKYFTRNRQFNSLAEAINAGVEPHSVNLADLAQHRISASRKLIIQKGIFNELNRTMLPDGQPVVKPIGHYQDANGQFHMNVPSGYDLIRANGIDLAVHPEVSGVFKSLYGDSALRRTKVGRAVMKTAAVEKAYTLAVDTFHGFRGIMKNLFYGGKNSRLGYEKGLTVYELSNEALDTSVQRGEITQRQADWAKKSRPNIEAMMKHGLNVSRFSDNLVGQMHVTFPGARGVNDWIFKRVFRGAMLQAADANFQRNLSRFPELTKEQVAQRTVTEMNEVFGNLGSQGLFRDKTTRDILNLTFLAPQWVESQARAEFRGYGQAAKIIPDSLQGKFRVGTVAQGQATAVAAYLIGNQIINYATTGHSTFENEGIHKLDAFLPFGDRGIWLDPLAFSAEYVDQFIRVMDRQGDKATIPSVVSEIASHKLSGIGRAAVTVATQRDWRGRRLESSADIAMEAGRNLLPVPIFSKGITSGFELDPNSPTGFSYTPKWDEIAQQLFMSMGQKALLGPTGGQYPGGPLRVPEGEGGDIERPKRGRKQQEGVI